jgi:RNA polymerase sigma-70 factor (ECF subfamily)
VGAGGRVTLAHPRVNAWRACGVRLRHRTQPAGDWRRRGVVEQRALAQLGIAPLRLHDDEGPPDLDALEHLERLPPDQREAVRLRVLEELDYDEIAVRTGTTEPAVRQRVSRGLKWLRNRVER